MDCEHKFVSLGQMATGKCEVKAFVCLKCLAVKIERQKNRKRNDKWEKFTTTSIDTPPEE